MRPRVLSLLVAMASLARVERTMATPLDDPHVGGIGLSGPTTADLAAVYWNPAVLGLLGENQVLLAASARQTDVTVARAPIDPATGAPGGAKTSGLARSRTLLHPLSWPPGPGGFLGLGASLGNRFTLALAGYTPFVGRYDYKAPSGEEVPSTRYHVITADLRHVAVVPAIAFRLGGGVMLGAAPGFLFSVGRIVFDEDTALASGRAGLAGDCGGSPCGVENPAAAARYDVGSGLDPVESSLAFTFAGGVHIARPRFRAGLAFLSRPIGTEGISIHANRATVTRPPRAGGAPVCGPTLPSPCVLAEMTYGLPDTLVAGATLHATPLWDLDLIGRWLNFSRHESLRIRLGGPVSDGLRPDLPEHVVLHRGFQDVFDVRLRASRKIAERFLVAATARAETSAVPASHVSPGAVDSFKLEPAIALRVRLGSFGIAAGYAFTFFLPVDPAGGAFDPGAVAACDDARGALDDPACAKRNEGLARPAALGRYTQTAHTLSLAVSARL